MNFNLDDLSGLNLGLDNTTVFNSSSQPGLQGRLGQPNGPFDSTGLGLMSGSSSQLTYASDFNFLNNSLPLPQLQPVSGSTLNAQGQGPLYGYGLAGLGLPNVQPQAVANYGQLGQHVLPQQGLGTQGLGLQMPMFMPQQQQQHQHQHQHQLHQHQLQQQQRASLPSQGLSAVRVNSFSQGGLAQPLQATAHSTQQGAGLDLAGLLAQTQPNTVRGLGNSEAALPTNVAQVQALLARYQQQQQAQPQAQQQRPHTAHQQAQPGGPRRTSASTAAILNQAAVVLSNSAGVGGGQQAGTRRKGRQQQVAQALQRDSAARNLLLNTRINFNMARSLQVRRTALEALVAQHDERSCRHFLVRVNVGGPQGANYKIAQIDCLKPDARPPQISLMLDGRLTVIPVSSVSEKEMSEAEWTVAQLPITVEVLWRLVSQNTWAQNHYVQGGNVINYNTNIISLNLYTQNGKKEEPPPVPVEKRTYLDAVEDDDPEVLGFERTIVSLRCPISLTRMRVPVKGRNCAHAQCFDRDSFAQVLRQRRAPGQMNKCPICKSPLRSLDDLVVDEALQKIIKETEKPPKIPVHDDDDDTDDEDGPCMQVEIHKDGSWTAVDEHPNKNKRMKTDSDAHDAAAATPGAAKKEVETPGPGKAPAEVVVLDSDDE